MKQAVVETLGDLLYRLCLRKHGVVQVPHTPAAIRLHMPPVWMTTKIGKADFGLLPRAFYTGRLATFDHAYEMWLEVASLAVTPRGTPQRIQTLLSGVVPELVEAHHGGSVMHLLARFLVVASWTDDSQAQLRLNKLVVRCGSRSLTMTGPQLGWDIGLHGWRGRRFKGFVHGLTPEAAPRLASIVTSPLRSIGPSSLGASAVIRYLYDTLPGMGREIDAVFGAARKLGTATEKMLVDRFGVDKSIDTAARAELAALVEFNNLIGKKK